MVATLEEAFGPTLPRKKKCKQLPREYKGNPVKQLEKNFDYTDHSNVYNKTSFDSNTNINSNDIDITKNQWTYQKNLKERVVPPEETAIRNMPKVPYEMSGSGEPASGSYAAAPGAMEAQYMHPSDTKYFTPNEANSANISKYIDEPVSQGVPQRDPVTTRQVPVTTQQVKEEFGMGDITNRVSGFEDSIMKHIESLHDKINELSYTGGKDDLSNSFDVLLFIFVGIMFLFLFDMVHKLGKR